jgi:hypothetical protein
MIETGERLIGESDAKIRQMKQRTAIGHAAKKKESESFEIHCVHRTIAAPIRYACYYRIPSDFSITVYQINVDFQREQLRIALTGCGNVSDEL